MGLISRVSSRTYRTKMSLSEDEVQRQIQIMVSFIEQEAKEKVEEIDAKAEEEFQIEKGRIVQQQRTKIQEHFDKKEKQLHQQKVVQQSRMLNKSRLELLKSRDSSIESVIEKTKYALMHRKDDPKMIENLILQAMNQVEEKQVTIHCLEDQLRLVENSVNKVEQIYNHSHQSNPCKITVDSQKFLHESKIGGIKLVTNKGKLTVDNTLLARLELTADHLMPQIRTMLFGHNKNRMFFD